MEIDTIKCPYCFKESKHGVHVCTGCMATVLYGVYPQWYAFVAIFISFIISAMIGMGAGMAGFAISMPIICIVALVVGKAIFSDNVVFRRRM